MCKQKESMYYLYKKYKKKLNDARKGQIIK